jgi:glycosyltransferase involved in cell wall biosynthesis
MIVKNESKIILRLLESVLPMIDTYCICDTGSTDNTKELIEEYFNEQNITGKIIEEPFKDFGYNRTFALQACLGMPNADYILLLDADINNNLLILLS